MGLLDQAIQLLEGAYDLHMHAKPSCFNRKLDDYELVEDADKYKMAGIMLKSHYESTAARAALVNLHSGCKAKAFGGIALNWPVGGLNPYAVENALQMGAKIVWMPTRDSKNSLVFGDMPGDFFKRPGISILDENDELRSEVYDIFDCIKKHDAWLATGHLSPDESVVLCKEGIKNKVNMILTHPEFSRTRIDNSTQKELAEKGVVVEKAWYNIAEGNVSLEEMCTAIREVGYEHCYLVTDRGQKDRPSPVEAMIEFNQKLLEQGFKKYELMEMLHNVPQKIIN